MAKGKGSNGGGAAVRDPALDRTRLRAIHAALTGGDIAAAARLAEDSLADGIAHPMVLNLVAGRREEEGRHEEALALLRRALAAAPEAVGVMNAIGLCLQRLGRHEEAADAFGAALARAPDFAPAFANRASALAQLGREDEAARDYAAAAAIDPANLVAADGLAARALAQGEAGEARRLAGQVLAREPDYPSALLTLAGADLAEGRAAAAEAALGALLADRRLDPVGRALAWGLRGDALDALGRFAEAFSAWREANALQKLHDQQLHGPRPDTTALVRALAAALAGRRVPAAWGHGGRSPAKAHVFVVGFPGSGAARLGRALAAAPEAVLLAGCEGLLDAARDWLAGADRLAAFCDADDDALEPYRDAYWARVAEAGVAIEGRVLVDANPLNAFKLPLIARLFPDARVIEVGREARDALLAAFRRRWPMSDPVHRLLTLEGAAALYAATRALSAASVAAFGLFMHGVTLEELAADPDRALGAAAAFAGLARPAAPWPLPAVPGDRIGQWRDHEAALAAALPLLEESADRPR